MGILIERMAPLEYSLLRKVGGEAPSAALIETLSYASLNPFFRSRAFHDALKEYRVYGVYPPRPSKPNAIMEYRAIIFKRDLYSRF